MKFVLVAILAVAVFFIVLRRRHMSRLKMVESWLAVLGFKVIHVGEARLYDDPQFIHLSAEQRLTYYVDVVDPHGQYLSGVVLLGGTLLSPRVEGTVVHWADLELPERSAGGFEVIPLPPKPTQP